MRDQISKATKEAMKSKNQLELSTLRLMSAAIKERDLVHRGDTGDEDGVEEAEIVQVLATMVKQRRESAKSYEDGNRPDLAERELEEIKVIERFLPAQLSEEEVASAIQTAIGASGAASIKDMGKVMAALKSEYTGQMDFAAASAHVKKALSEL